MPGAKPPISKPYIPLIPHMPHIVKPLYKGLGIIHLKPWFVKYFVCRICPKKPAIFYEKILILLKNLIKVYKGLEKSGKILHSFVMYLYRWFGISFISPAKKRGLRNV
jgi:hypothetical protein